MSTLEATQTGPPDAAAESTALASLGRLRGRTVAGFAVLIVGALALALLGVAVGSIAIPFDATLNALAGLFGASEAAGGEQSVWTTVIRQIRIPRTLTALLAGAALGVAGLQMQTLFRNPLADPFVLGVSAGASFGVAAVVLVAGTGLTLFTAGLGWLGDLGLAGAAFVGAAFVMALVLALSLRVRSIVTVLIVGLLVGQLVGALITILISAAEEQYVDQFVRWGFGSFRGVTWSELGILAPAVAVGVIIALLSVKQLNALLLGESYARSLGVHVRRAQLAAMLGAALLAGSVTAFAGPIAFLGVAIPHLARGLFRTSDHRVLAPAVILCGGILALAAEIVAQLPGVGSVLPLNAVTALIGAPVVLSVLLRRRRLSAV